MSAPSPSTVPGMQRPATGFSDLPNEILLEIVEKHLRVDTESSAKLTVVDLDMLEVETFGCDRSRQNTRREKALKSLCLTSKRLSDIATPVLYSSIILSTPGKDTFTRLTKLLRTILRQRHLAQHIKYVEISAFMEGYDPYEFFGDEEADRLSLYMDTTLEQRKWEKTFSRMIVPAARVWGPVSSNLLATWLEQVRLFPELALFALLVTLAPNISHIKLGTIWEALSIILKLIGLHHTASSLDRPTPSFHKLRKLERLSLVFLGEDMHLSHGDNRASPWMVDILKNLPVVPDVSLIGPYFADFIEDPESGLPISDYFPKISRLSMQDTVLDGKEIATILKGCSLTHLEVAWRHEFDDLDTSGSPASIPTLISELQDRAAMLTSLDLQASMGDCDWDETIPQVDFSAFTSLANLVTPQITLFGSDDDAGKRIEFWREEKPVQRLSKCLPPNLVTLRTVFQEHVGMSDDSAAWWDFAGDLDKLPRLERVEVEEGRLWTDFNFEGGDLPWKDHTLDWTKLTAAFRDKGVRLNVE